MTMQFRRRLAILIGSGWTLAIWALISSLKKLPENK